jgi:hypothetical protein
MVEVKLTGDKIAWPLSIEDIFSILPSIVINYEITKMQNSEKIVFNKHDWETNDLLLGISVSDTTYKNIEVTTTVDKGDTLLIRGLINLRTKSFEDIVSTIQTSLRNLDLILIY